MNGTRNWREGRGARAVATLPLLTLLSALSLALPGCAQHSGSDRAAGGAAGGPGQGGAGTIDVDEGFPGGVSRFRRLTHSEWALTVRDLLDVDGGSALASAFRADPRQGGYLFEGNGDALEVDQALWSSYQRAALALAEAAVSDAAFLARWLPSDPGLVERDRARLFIQDFGLRAHRRPLSATEVERYISVYYVGRDAFEGMPGLEGGIRLVVEAFLQSPHFLYRVEESDAVESGIIPLSGYERASRLSYFLWGTMPDEELLAAAASGDLDQAAGVRAQAKRMVHDARASDTIVHFFERVLEVERYESISPAESAFPDAPQNLADAALGETQSFLRGIMAEGGGSLRDLLTSTKTYVTADLAAIYGLEGDFDETFVEASLNPRERAGVLTQIGFLAAHATSRDPDPIHRGVFVARRLSCFAISAPPDGVPPLPPNPGGKTNRQLVEEHTQAEGSSCASCHVNFINPFGFAFEHYDALGAYRTQDGDQEVNASVDALIDGDFVSVDGATDLAGWLAESEEVHQCLTGYLVAYALGRSTMSADAEVIGSLTQRSLEGAVSFADLMMEMAVAVSFLNRRAAGEP